MPSRFSRLIAAVQTRAGVAFEQAITAIQSIPDPRNKRVEVGKTPPPGEFTDLPVSVWADWTLLKIKTALNAFLLGNFGPAAILVEGMLSDDRIQGATNGRIKGITKCDAVFTPSELPDSDKVAKEIEALWPDILPEETVEWIETWAIFLNFALVEVIWETKQVKGEDKWVPRLKVWHPLYIYYDNQYRRYMVITQEGIIPVIPGDPRWFLYTPGGEYRGWLKGAVRSCSAPWVMRQYAFRDWGRFSEKHGLPMIVAKVPAQSSAEDKARFFASVRNLGSDTGIQIPVQGGQDAANWDVELLEAKDTSWKSFQGLIQACDQSITLSIRGTNLTTNVEGGSYAAADTHRAEDSDLSISDRKKLAAALKRQLLEPYASFNYGNKDLAPSLAYVSPESNPKDEAEVLLKVSQAMTGFASLGWPVDRQVVSDKFSIPLEDVTETKEEEATNIVLAPTDLASIVTVNEARSAQHLDPLKLPDGSEDPDGSLTIEAFRNKSKPTPNVSPGKPDTESGSVGVEPPLDDEAPKPGDPGNH